ncbi:GTP-binding protein, partial [Roseibacillus ishigakijimensis]
GMARPFLMKDEFSSEGKIKGRFVLVGGFLGAGKTTLIGRMALWMKAKGREVARGGAGDQ